MSTTVTPVTPAPPAQSELQKIWNWIKSKVIVVEKDLAAIVGSTEAAKIESAGKALLESWIGPLAQVAMQEATDVLTGQMSVSKAVAALVKAAEASGKSISQAAALQAVALLQNSVPTNTDATVTPIA